MFNNILSGIGFIILFLFIAVLFFYPLWIAVFLYSAACFVYNRIIDKRGLNISPMKYSAFRLIFVVSSLLIGFLIGLISFNLDEILAWNIIPAFASYLAGVGVYYLMKLIGKKKDAQRDEYDLKNKGILRKVLAIIVGVLVFIIALMMGISFVAMTLM